MHCMAFKIGKWNIEGVKSLHDTPSFNNTQSFALVFAIATITLLLSARESLA